MQAEQEREGPSGLSLFPLPGYVILEPAEDPPTTGGLYSLSAMMNKYPQVGWCVATSSSEIEIGDLCIINVESSDVARQYRKVFALHLKDWGTELFDPDVEPAIKAAVDRYRDNPATDDSKIRVETLTGEHLSFLASDVLAMDWSFRDSAEFSLLYPEHVRMAELDSGLFYFVHEDNILGVIEHD